MVFRHRGGKSYSRRRFIGPNTHQSNEMELILRRGEGGGAARGGPLWSPDVLVPLHHHAINKLGYAGDRKGPPNPSQPPSPLREPPAILSLMRITADLSALMRMIPGVSRPPDRGISASGSLCGSVSITCLLTLRAPRSSPLQESFPQKAGDCEKDRRGKILSCPRAEPGERTEQHQLANTVGTVPQYW